MDYNAKKSINIFVVLFSCRFFCFFTSRIPIKGQNRFLNVLKFACKVEADVFKIILGHLQHVITVGQENVAPFTVFCHVLVFSFFEVFKFGRIVTFYPAGLVQAYGFPAAFCVVFVFQTILDDFKLQLAYGSYNFSVVELVA